MQTAAAFSGASIPIGRNGQCPWRVEGAALRNKIVVNGLEQYRRVAVNIGAVVVAPFAGRFGSFDLYLLAAFALRPKMQLDGNHFGRFGGNTSAKK